VRLRNRFAVFLGQAAGFAEITGQGALAIRWARVFMGAFSLGFIGQYHFMDRWTARNGGVEYGHDDLQKIVAATHFTIGRNRAIVRKRCVNLRRISSRRSGQRRLLLKCADARTQDENRHFPEPLTVAGLIEQLGYAGKRIAIERNGEIVPKSQHAATALGSGDCLEIVVAVGGG